jgi:hypothetical protein
MKGGIAMTWAEIVNVIKDLITSLATIGSAIWIVVTYLRHQREAQEERSAQSQRDNKARVFEARKPFNDKQLAVYSDVAGVAGKLATITDLDSSEWEQNVTRFYQLFWAELSMVEDGSVKKAMEDFSTQLQEMMKDDSEYGVGANDFTELQQRAYRLASALRASIASSWDVKLADLSERPIAS